MKKAIVIGSGIGGLSAAVRLAAKGFDVKVFEAKEFLGGKLSQIEQDGYRFDAGPSVFTLPQIIDELIQYAGKNPKDYFDYEKLDESFRYFWVDGTRLTYYHDQAKLKQEIETKLNTSFEPVAKYQEKAALLFEKNYPLFLEKSLHKIGTYFSKEAIATLPHLHRFDLFKTMHEANVKHFEHPKLVQMFDRFATYNGSNPFMAPGVLNMISHLESRIGTYFPKGSMIGITNSVVKLAKDLGVEFIMNTKVDEIVVQNKQVKGVRIGQEKYDADVVVSNSDVYFTYNELLKNQGIKSKAAEQERSSSGIIFYLGIKKEFKELGLHNFFFSDNMEEEFDHIFNKKIVYDDPSIYINITSKYNKDDAPEGCENWFLMMNAPANDGSQDWDEQTEKAYRVMLDKVSKQLGTDVEQYIETKTFLNPPKIKERTNSYQGSIYGTSSNAKMSAFFRHSNYSKKIKGLYFSGGSVHPGGGIPLSVLSSKIMVENMREVRN
ncbi:MAG: phytoene desaturase [Crocinitomicaceae bacterium]|nr:phytoene desaturase [Crocinitomicaceae bacterium]